MLGNFHSQLRDNYKKILLFLKAKMKFTFSFHRQIYTFNL